MREGEVRDTWMSILCEDMQLLMSICLFRAL